MADYPGFLNIGAEANQRARRGKQPLHAPKPLGTTGFAKGGLMTSKFLSGGSFKPRGFVQLAGHTAKPKRNDDEWDSDANSDDEMPECAAGAQFCRRITSESV